MKNQRLLTVIIIAGLMLACNLPTAASQPNQAPSAAETSQPDAAVGAPITPTETQIQVTPTLTDIPLPTLTPSITPTTTPAAATITAKKEAVNCRFGPGTEWAPVNGLPAFDSAPLLGKSADGGWWLIQIGSSSCWVAASVTTTSGDMGQVAVVGVPQAFITKVTIETNPVKIDVSGCIFPVSITYTATIEVNGPLAVQSHFELSQGNLTTPKETLVFAKFGSKTLEDSYHVGAEGDYWVKIIIDSPKPMNFKAEYSAVCS